MSSPAIPIGFHNAFSSRSTDDRGPDMPRARRAPPSGLRQARGGAHARRRRSRGHGPQHTAAGAADSGQATGTTAPDRSRAGVHEVAKTPSGRALAHASAGAARPPGRPTRERRVATAETRDTPHRAHAGETESVSRPSVDPSAESAAACSLVRRPDSERYQSGLWCPQNGNFAVSARECPPRAIRHWPLHALINQLEQREAGPNTKHSNRRSSAHTDGSASSGFVVCLQKPHREQRSGSAALVPLRGRLH